MAGAKPVVVTERYVEVTMGERDHYKMTEQEAEKLARAIIESVQYLREGRATAGRPT